MTQANDFQKQGVAHFQKEKWQKAYDCFLKAHRLNPKDWVFLESLGSAATMLNRYEDAKAYYAKALKLAGKTPSLSLLRNYALLLQKFGTAEAYTTAKGLYEKAISLSSGEVSNSLYYTYALMLQTMGDIPAAIIQYENLLKQSPSSGPALYNLAACYMAQMQMVKAVASYEKLRKLAPENRVVLSQLSYCYHILCAWDKADEIDDFLLKSAPEAIKNYEINLMEVFLSVFQKVDASHQKKLAESQSQRILLEQKQKNLKLTPSKKKQKKTRLRVGYFSVALANHPTAELICDLFQHHNRESFEVFVYAAHGLAEDEKLAKIKQSVEHFYAINTKDDLAVAAFIQSHQLDVLIDIDGIIKDNRQGALSLKPAPIQIAWLGYPGTSGAPWNDYILADAVVIPKKHEVFYSEKILRKKGSYQFNSFASMEIGPSKRADWGLPQDTFVFASFNLSCKFDRETVDAWCDILQRVDNSVLWLYAPEDVCFENLKAEVKAKGLNPDRLIRALRVGGKTHLTRFQCADLFLDSFICNAHTTCTEALAAGLPVITMQGHTFASRVAASILTAADMKNCVTHSKQEYIDLACELAQRPKKLNGLKQHLLHNKRHLPLFNQKAWVEDLEDILKDIVG